VSGQPSWPAPLPGDVLEDTVPEQPDPQPAQVAELPVSLRLGHLTAMYCLVEERQRDGFYRAAGFVDCGITVTDLGTARAWC